MPMQRPLIVGGASGIGLALAHRLAARPEVGHVYIVDRNAVPTEQSHSKFVPYRFDLASDDFSIFDQLVDADTLLITAGFGRLAPFSEIDDAHIQTSFAVNTVAVSRLLHRFFPRLLESTPFPCLVMGSIAGFMSSPLYAIYGATKAALKVLIESLNVELEMASTPNRILHVAPGSIRGTRFNATQADALTNLEAVTPLADEILQHLEAGDDRFIPQYEEVFRHVLERAHADFRAEGRHSYHYKLQTLAQRQ